MGHAPSFNEELIGALYRLRNRYDVRAWLRQCIALERKRRAARHVHVPSAYSRCEVCGAVGYYNASVRA